jgi:hypothetical protein
MMLLEVPVVRERHPVRIEVQVRGGLQRPRFGSEIHRWWFLAVKRLALGEMRRIDPVCEPTADLNPCALAACRGAGDETVSSR